MATVAYTPAEKTTEPFTLEDLAQIFGPMPPGRIRWQPAPGTATEEDCLQAVEAGGRLCELIKGVLVDKPMGLFESRLAGVLFFFMERFLDEQDLGIAFPADAMMRLGVSRIRLPDVSFIAWQRLPGRRLPREAACPYPPDLAVEVLSPSNTRQEMDRKLREYFEAGVRLVWYVEPAQRQVRVFTAVDQSEVVTADGILRGGDVLPGFELSIREWFDRAERQSGPNVG